MSVREFIREACSLAALETLRVDVDEIDPWSRKRAESYGVSSADLLEAAGKPLA